MTDEAIQAFSLRVTQANQSELTVITYEIILEYIEEACDALDNADYDNYIIYSKKARQFISELMAALNYGNPVSFNLIRIYEYAHMQLVNAEHSKDKAGIREVSKILNILLDAFRKVAEEDSSPAVMMNTQQVYAGLTYGRGHLNETCLDPGNMGRGFQA